MGGVRAVPLESTATINVHIVPDHWVCPKVLVGGMT